LIGEVTGVLPRLGAISWENGNQITPNYEYKYLGALVTEKREKQPRTSSIKNQ
jgi:hypothetical protein